MEKTKVVVVGGGLAGLMATLKITEKQIPVDLISLVPVKRSHSVCAQGGVNAALDTKGQHDTVEQHFYDTIYGGDFLANQTPVKGMVENAPGLEHQIALRYHSVPALMDHPELQKDSEDVGATRTEVSDRLRPQFHVAILPLFLA